MPTGVYKRTKAHLEQIRELATKKMGKHNFRYSINNNGCWVWQGAQDGRGYGNLSHLKKYIKAHKYFYEQKYGPVSHGKELDHLCENKLCVNPDHLEAVTHCVNSQRAIGKHFLQIKEMFVLYNTGHKKAEISRIMRIPERTVGGILNGERWKNFLRVEAQLRMPFVLAPAC